MPDNNKIWMAKKQMVNPDPKATRPVFPPKPRPARPGSVRPLVNEIAEARGVQINAGMINEATMSNMFLEIERDQFLAMERGAQLAKLRDVQQARISQQRQVKGLENRISAAEAEVNRLQGVANDYYRKCGQANTQLQEVMAKLEQTEKALREAVEVEERRLAEGAELAAFLIKPQGKVMKQVPRPRIGFDEEGE